MTEEQNKRRRLWPFLLVAAAVIIAVSSSVDAQNRIFRHYTEDGNTSFTQVWPTNLTNITWNSINGDNPVCEWQVGDNSSGGPWTCINRTAFYTCSGNVCTVLSGGGAPTSAQYVTMALDATLTAERRLQPGRGITLVDGGANADVTVNITGLETCVGTNSSQWNGSEWNCLSPTASGSNGTVHSLTEGVGINLTPDTITSNGSIGISNLETCTNPTSEYSVWNGSHWRCENDASGGSGTVTSINISVNGTEAINVTGGPITTSGTFVVRTQNATVFNDGLITAVDFTTFSNKAGSGDCSGQNSTHVNVTMNVTTAGPECVSVALNPGTGTGSGNTSGIGINNYVARWNSTSTLTTGSIQDNGTIVNLSGDLNIDGYIISGRGCCAPNGDPIRIYPANSTYGYTQIAFYPESNTSHTEGDVLFNIHKQHYPDNTSHQHFSIYTTNSANAGSMVKRWDLDYAADYADLDIQNINSFQVRTNTFKIQDIENNTFVSQGLQWGEIELNFDSSTNFTHLDFDLEVNDTPGGTADVRFFRNVNIPNAAIIVYKGDNTTTKAFQLNAKTGWITDISNITGDNDGVSSDQWHIFNGDRARVGYNGSSQRVSLVGGTGKGIDFISDGGSQRSIFSSTGRLGVNNSNPNSTLHVVGDANVTTILYTPQICLADDCRTAWPSAGSSYTFASTNGGIDIQNGTSVNFTLDVGYLNNTHTLDWLNITQRGVANGSGQCTGGQFANNVTVNQSGVFINCSAPAAGSGNATSTGNGTANYLAKFNSSINIQSSQLSENGSHVFFFGRPFLTFTNSSCWEFTTPNGSVSNVLCN